MGKKLESSFKNMVLVLFLVTLISSAAVGVVNSLTAGLIEKVQIEKQTQAIRAVVPAFDNDPMTDKYMVKASDNEEAVEFYPCQTKWRISGYSHQNLHERRVRWKNRINGRLHPGRRDLQLFRVKPQGNPGIRFQNGFLVRERRERRYYR